MTIKHQYPAYTRTLKICSCFGCPLWNVNERALTPDLNFQLIFLSTQQCILYLLLFVSFSVSPQLQINSCFRPSAGCIIDRWDHNSGGSLLCLDSWVCKGGRDEEVPGLLSYEGTAPRLVHMPPPMFFSRCSRSEFLCGVFWSLRCGCFNPLHVLQIVQEDLSRMIPQEKQVGTKHHFLCNICWFLILHRS